MTYTLILLRHGESEWNAKNLFTGWVDVALTEKGRDRGRARRRAAARGRACCPTSCTPRCCAARSPPRDLALDAADRHWIPVRRSWRLNERHYGALQGKDKKQTLERVRRGAVHALAPLLRRTPAAARRRRRVLPGRRPALRRPRRRAARAPSASRTSSRGCCPTGTSAIVPDLRAGQTVLVAAHGNSLRALVKHLDGISDEDIAGPEHPDRHPAGLPPRRRPAPDRARRRVPRPRGREAAAAAVANQGR